MIGSFLHAKLCVVRVIDYVFDDLLGEVIFFIYRICNLIDIIKEPLLDLWRILNWVFLI